MCVSLSDIPPINSLRTTYRHSPLCKIVLYDVLIIGNPLFSEADQQGRPPTTKSKAPLMSTKKATKAPLKSIIKGRHLFDINVPYPIFLWEYCVTGAAALHETKLLKCKRLRLGFLEQLFNDLFKDLPVNVHEVDWARSRLATQRR